MAELMMIIYLLTYYTQCIV